MSRRATIRTTYDDPDLVARALRPDNTDEMETTVSDDGDAVVTHIERETTGGLHSTVDDYVVNLEVAADVARQARAPHSTGDEQRERPTDAGCASDHDSEPATNNNE